MSDDDLFAPVKGIAIPTAPVAPPSVGGFWVPQLWLDVIDMIRKPVLTVSAIGEPSWAEATIAGGALRDLENGRPVKDVDIFVPYSDNCYDRLEKILEKLGIDTDLNLDEIKHDSKNRSTASKVSTKHHNLSHFTFYHDGWKFEVTQKVEAFDHYTILDSFDIGLCMISLAGNSNSIYRTPQYLDDVANKTITIVRDTGGGETHHAKRISRKYSTWKIQRARSITSP